jgi:Flp pilus assembly protein TadD
MKNINLSEQDISKYRQKYGSQLTFLFSDLVGAISTIDELYHAPHFNKHLPWNPESFSTLIFPNLKLIVEAIKKNIPQLSRIEEKVGRLNIAFCRNLWLHDLLLDESWESDEQKSSYINYAFQEVFRQFDTKVCANFDIEFLPYDLPWSTISSISPLTDEEQWQLAQKQYSDFYQPKFLPEKNFNAAERETLNTEDHLYYALRTSNQLRDHRKRMFYFDLGKFSLYSKFTNLLQEITSPNALQIELKKSLLYYEFKRGMIWNASFLLKPNEFRTLIDSLRGQPLLEGLVQVGAGEQEMFLRKVLRDTQPQPEIKETSNTSLSYNMASSRMFGNSMATKHGELLGHSGANSDQKQEEIEQISVLTEELRFELSTPEELQQSIQHDKNLFIQQWQDGIKELNEVYYVVDHAQLLDQADNSILKMLENHSAHQQTKRVNRSSEGKALSFALGNERVIEIPIIQSATKLQALTGTLAKLLPWLSALSRFDQGVVKLLASLQNLQWSDDDWYQLGQVNWIEPQSRNWMSISTIREVEAFVTPRSLLDFQEQWRMPLLDYLENYLSEDTEEQSSVHLDFLLYSLKWKTPQAEESWLHFWLQSLSKNKFDFAEKTLALGEPFKESILQKIAPKCESFQHGIFRIRQLLKDFVLQSQQTALSKQQQKLIWKEVSHFCQAAITLEISVEKRLAVYQAAQQILIQLSPSKQVWKSFLNLCSGEEVSSLFVERRSDYLLYLIRLYEKHADYSNFLPVWKKEYLTLFNFNNEEIIEGDLKLIARFQIDLKKWQQALNSFRKLESITLEPKLKVSCRKTIFALLSKLELHQEALILIEDTLEGQVFKGSDIFSLHLQKSHILNRLERSEDALFLLNSLLDDNNPLTTEPLTLSEQAKVFLNLSQILDNNQEQQHAISMAFSLVPEDNKVKFHYSQYLYEQNDPELILKIEQSYVNSVEEKAQWQKVKKMVEGLHLMNSGDVEDGFALISANTDKKLSNSDKPNFSLEIMKLKGKGKLGQALKLVKEEIKVEGELPDILWLRLDLQLETKKSNNFNAAKVTIKSLSALLDGFLDKDKLRISSIYNKNNYFDESLKWLEKVSSEQYKSKKYLELKTNNLKRQNKFDTDLRDALNTAIALYPEDVEFLFTQVVYFEHNKSFQQALESAIKITNLEPEVSDGWNIKGVMLAELDRIDEALIAFNTALKISPKNQYHLENVCLAHIQLNRFQEGLSISEEWRLSTPTSDSWKLNGLALQMLNRFQEAMDCYNESLKLKPRCLDTLYFKAVLLHNTNQNEQALRVLEKSIRLDPNGYASYLKSNVELFCDTHDSTELTYNRIDTYFTSSKEGFDEKLSENEGETEETILKDLTKTVREHPVPYSLYLYLGLAQYCFGNYSESLNCFKNAGKLNPKSLLPRYLIISNTWKLRQFDSCLNEVEKFLFDKPYKTDLTLKKVSLLYILGREEEGSELLTSLLHKHPELSTEAYYNQAVSYALLNNISEALSYLNKIKGEDSKEILQRLKEDDDFSALKELTEFQALISDSEEEELSKENH